MTLLRARPHRRADERTPHLDRVVVGVDDSPASVAALAWALEQARRNGCPLEVVTAWPAATEEFVREVPGHYSAPRGRAVNEQEAALRLVGALDAAVEVETVVVNARPQEALVERCGEGALLVVGASHRGRHGGTRRRPVDDLCRAQAPCPVVVVPEGGLPGA